MGRLRALVVCACVQGLLFGPAAASARPLLGDQPQSVADRYVPQPPGIPVSTWVSGLEVPWSLVFLPDGRALVSERRGRIRLIAANGTMDPVPYATFRHDLLQGRSDDGDAEEWGFASHRVQPGGCYRAAAIKRWFATGPARGRYGRLRDVVRGPDQSLYVLISNRDGRGTPRPGDDRILKLTPR